MTIAPDATSRKAGQRCADLAPGNQRGVVLLSILLGLALSAICAMAAMDCWAVTKRRERELDLLFIGDQYRSAIRRYYFAAPPGRARTLPTSLEELLEDHRFPIPMCHLRRIYVDPLTGNAEWGLHRIGPAIVGVYSLSTLAPIKQSGFAPTNRLFDGKERYVDWVFDFTPS